MALTGEQISNDLSRARRKRDEADRLEREAAKLRRDAAEIERLVEAARVAR